MATWKIGAKKDLPIADTERAWDGPAAQARIFEMEEAQWKTAHLIYDADKPELHGSYKLPFADVVDGTLMAIPAGLRASANRLPQTDAPQEVLDWARAVLDGYFAEMEDEDEEDAADADDDGKRATGAMEYKAVGLEVKADGDEGIYEGYFAIFENVDDGFDIMHQGAFARTLEKRANRVKVFYAHDWDKLIGPPPTELREDEKGLFARGKLSLGTFWGKEVWALMKDGALTEGSIGYRAKDYEYGENGLRHLYAVDLYEISPVPLGMNPLTELRAIKSALGLQGDVSAASLVERIERLSATVDELKAGRALVTATEEQREKAAGSVDGVIDALLDGQRSTLELRLRMAELAWRL